ncbi:MAG TPA: hypothetical protein VIM61_06645 [Chthoniobacterales bacterium]|jgi:hypothetical protein
MSAIKSMFENSVTPRSNKVKAIEYLTARRRCGDASEDLLRESAELEEPRA